MDEKYAAIARTLIRARALIALEDRWIRGRFACTDRGTSVDATNPKAVCFCMLGALQHVTNSRHKYETAEYDAAEFLMRRTVLATLAWWNDQTGRTHAEVLAAFSRAIASLGATDG